MQARGVTRSWTTYISVASADDVAARITAAGGRVLSEPFDVMEQARMAVAADPGGSLNASHPPPKPSPPAMIHSE